MVLATNMARFGHKSCFPSLTIYRYKWSQYNLFSLHSNSLFCRMKLTAPISSDWCQHEIIHLKNLIYIQYSRNINGHYFLYPGLVDDLHVKHKCILTITRSMFTISLLRQQDLVLVRYYGTGLGRVSINLIEIVRPLPSCNAVFLFWTHLNHKVKDAVILLGPPKMMKWG